MVDIASLFSLQGKTAVVTGGNSGLGQAIGMALGAAGAKLVLTGSNAKKLEQAVSSFKEKGLLRIDSFVADLSNIEGIKAAAEIIDEAYSGADILVNAAGINLRQPFENVTAESWQAQINLHLTAPFFLTQALAPHMKKRNWGRIVNIASLQSTRAFADSAPYGAGKGGIVQLTRAIAESWSAHGINCNAIGPGFFPTPLTQAVFDDAKLARKHATHTCIGRNGKLSDIYGLAVFLASDACAYLTGQTIMLDGGFSAR